MGVVILMAAEPPEDLLCVSLVRTDSNQKARQTPSLWKIPTTSN